jgi:hypothetical protein
VDLLGIRQKYEGVKAQIDKQVREPLPVMTGGLSGGAKILDPHDIQEGFRKVREAQERDVEKVRDLQRRIGIKPSSR